MPRQLASSSLSTSWSYLPNSGDRRTSLTGQHLLFDANGNLTSDGQRNYTWDAENRLINITYPSISGKQTAFTYDGLSRRSAIASTPPGGGSPTTTTYLWCGSRICQARNSSNATIREHFAEGEFVPGSPGQPYYYGPDQIGSVRRVFASTTSAPAFSYDPYGNALQATAPLTDFNYAGIFYNTDSGLYLTQYRAYDPNTSRWLSRDPIGEDSDPNANLYSYVGGNPISFVDRQGLYGVPAGRGPNPLAITPPLPGLTDCANGNPPPPNVQEAMNLKEACTLILCLFHLQGDPVSPNVPPIIYPTNPPQTIRIEPEKKRDPIGGG